jgi:hypothetical protein
VGAVKTDVQYFAEKLSEGLLGFLGLIGRNELRPCLGVGMTQGNYSAHFIVTPAKPAAMENCERAE